MALLRSRTAFILGCGLCALALRLYRLGAQSLWLDEGSSWAEVTGRTGKGWLALIGELFSANAAYPLYHVLLKAWVALAGDSEWALRFPSALAGAAATVAIVLAAGELSRSSLVHPVDEPPRDVESSEPPALQPHRLGAPGVAAGLLMATSPFALWYAQDAKVYSLLMLMVALELWALLRALRRRDAPAWMLVVGIAATALFVHRLALLAVAGVALVAALGQGSGVRGQGSGALITARLQRRLGLAAIAVVLAIGGVAGTVLAMRGERPGAGHIAAGAADGLWLTFTRFGLDRWPGEVAGYLGLPLAVWLLPSALLTLWGLALLARDALRRHGPALAILCLFVVPLALFALALALTHVYEARYATVAFPAWLLVLVYPLTRPFGRQETGDRRQETGVKIERSETRPLIPDPRSLIPGPFVLCLLFSNVLLLVQPQKGLYSGDPLKEQWRDAITQLARQVHPDDLVILHPYYVAPLYDYYAPRVTPDPLPRPAIFPIFAEGDRQELKEFIRRRYEPFFAEVARGKKRMLLLIAPDHARTVDPPVDPLRDRFGWVGLRFQYPQRTWPCGDSGQAYIGVALMCQSFPEAYGTGEIPQPTTPLVATFGGEVRLRGYSLNLHGGAARPGGTLPIALYWEAVAPPTRDYRVFLHLCRDCSVPPLANDDGPPLGGHGDAGRTTTWRVGDPVHDERALVLPPGLEPGRYTLLLGLYPADDPAITARLPVVSAAPAPGGDRLILGEVVVIRP